MARFRFEIIGLFLFVILVLPIVRNTLEASMVRTMLIQFPLLIISGYMVAKGLFQKFGSKLNYFNENGIPGILMVVFMLTYWSLPRPLDAALNEPIFEVFKFVCLSVFTGMPLYLSWRLLGPITKSFFWANIISMIFVMAWAYYEAPVRLCNNYLEAAQKDLGRAMFIIGIALSVYFIIKLFIGKPNKHPINDELTSSV